MDLNKNARYGYAHRQLRRQWEIAILRGDEVKCWRCGWRIKPGDHWDLGHRDGGGPGDYRGPEHRRCSRGTAGRGLANTGNARQPAKPAEPAPLCEHMQRGERHGKLCCGNSRDW